MKKINLLLVLFFSVFLMVSCGGGSGSSDSSNGDTGTDGATAANESHIVSGVGLAITINSVNKTDLTISGTNNTITVESNLGNLILTGVGNLLIFSDDISVDDCIVSGDYNTAQENDTITMDCTISGTGNSGFGV